MKWQCLAFLFVGLLLAADSAKKEPDKKPAKDIDKIQGSWVAEKGEGDGNEFPAEFVSMMKVSFKGDKYTFEVGDLVEKGTMTFDSSKKPGTVDVKIEEGMDKDKSQVGIYKLDGDTLTLCFSRVEEKERPKEFATKTGSEQLLVVFKRPKS